MAASRIIVFGILLLAATLALAEPCIECKDCKGSNHCLKNCRKECPRKVVVNGEDCKKYGRDAGSKAAKEACDTTMLYCNGGQKKLGRAFPVSLGQCANIAYGLCQERAMNRWLSPCGGLSTATSSARKMTLCRFTQAK